MLAKQTRAFQNALEDLEVAKAYLIRAKCSGATLNDLRSVIARVRSEMENRAVGIRA